MTGWSPRDQAKNADTKKIVHPPAGGARDRGTLEIEFRAPEVASTAARARFSREHNRSRGCDRWNVTPFLRGTPSPPPRVGVAARGRGGGGRDLARADFRSLVARSDVTVARRYTCARITRVRCEGGRGSMKGHGVYFWIGNAGGLSRAGYIDKLARILRSSRSTCDPPHVRHIRARSRSWIVRRWGKGRGSSRWMSKSLFTGSSVRTYEWIPEEPSNYATTTPRSEEERLPPCASALFLRRDRRTSDIDYLDITARAISSRRRNPW